MSRRQSPFGGQPKLVNNLIEPPKPERETWTYPDSKLDIGTYKEPSNTLHRYSGAAQVYVTDQLREDYPEDALADWMDDVAWTGPEKIPLDEIDQPMGGGGTSFVPAFEEAAEKQFKRIVYLTDLEGTFPKEAPDDCRVLWVVPPGAKTDVPFGEVVRILDGEDA